MYASLARNLLDRRIVPVDALQREEIAVIGLARIGGRRAATLKLVVLRFHAALGGDELAPPLGVAQEARLLFQRLRAHGLPFGQDIERKIGLETKDGVDGARGALTEHAAAGVVHVLDDF